LINLGATPPNSLAKQKVNSCFATQTSSVLLLRKNSFAAQVLSSLLCASRLSARPGWASYTFLVSRFMPDTGE